MAKNSYSANTPTPSKPSMPKNEPHSVPGKGLGSGGKTEGLQHMHMTADKMAPHDTGMMAKPGDPYPASPAHAESRTLENSERIADQITPNDSNMSAGLGPIDVPGKGL
jgi:hypothetical protein